VSTFGRYRRGQLASVAAVAALVAVAVTVLTGTFRGPAGHTVIAEFADAQSITKGNTVHVDGVTAGTVTGIALRHNQAYLTLQLDRGFWPIHTDASATIRPISLLGENYVQLDPGTAAAPAMADGATITSAHTSSAVNLQSVLNAVNDPTATALGVVLTSLGQGMAGQGANAAAALKALSPALDNTTALTDLLDQQNQTLTSLIDQITPVTRALATGNGQTLDHLVSTATTTLGATAKQSQALGADLQSLPAFLHSTASAFTQLGVLSDQATPALRSLTPLTDNLAGVSLELRNFSDAADPAITSLQPVLAQADNLLAQTGPVIDDLRASAPSMQPDANALVPLVQQGLTGGCSATACPGLDNLFNFVKNWSLATQNYDGLSHYFRFFINLSTTPVSGIPGLSSLLGAATGTSPAAPSAAPAGAAPAAGSPLGSVLAPVTGALPAVTAPVNSLTNTIGTTLGGLLGAASTPGSSPGSPPSAAPGSGQSATGLSQGQEQSLFSYLLGGA
jgi:phospholipid/cholesterol/gamma-HCH transport system substrate-binding protein